MQKKPHFCGLRFGDFRNRVQAYAAAVLSAYLPATTKGTACLTKKLWHWPGLALPLSRFLANTLQPAALILLKKLWDGADSQKI